MTQDAQDVSLKGLRVMFIDDSKTIRTILKKYLLTIRRSSSSIS